MATIIDDVKGVKAIQKADGTVCYQITVSKGIDPHTGRQKRRYKTFTPYPGMSKREIKAELEKIRVELGGGRTNPNSKESRKPFVVYAAELVDRRERSGQYKARTATGYRRLLEIIQDDFGNLPLNEITPEMIEAFYDNLRRTGSRKSNRTMTVKPSLKAVMESKGMRDKQVIAESHISRFTFQKIKRGDPVTKEIAKRVSEALGKRTTELFDPVVSDAPLSEKTIQIYAHFIGGVFTAAVKRGIIQDNPVAIADKPIPVHKEIEAIDAKTMGKVFSLLEEEPLRWKVIVYLLALTGARRGEIAGLRWQDIDFDGGLITIAHSLNYTPDHGIFLDSTKTRNRRTVKLPKDVLTMLRQYKIEQTEFILACHGNYNNQGYLFAQPDGSPSNPESITSWFWRFSRRHNLDGVHAHAFRHSAASILITNGVDVVTVAAMLGHADPGTTERVYAHALEESRTRAAECLADAIYKHA